MEMTGGIEVRITGATPLEVLTRITAWGLRCYREPSVQRLANQLMELENSLNAYPKEGEAPAPSASPVDPSGPVAGENGPAAAPSEKVDKDADPPAPAPKPEATPAPSPAPTTSKVPSLEDIRAKGVKAARKYGNPAVKAILKELNAENMTTLPEEKRATFLEKLEGLGEGNA